MKSEAITDLSPSRVLELARSFFTGPEAVEPASLSEESDGHVTFATFRSRIVVSAFPDPRGEAPTRVRVSTLREYAAADRFLTWLRTRSGKVEQARGATG